MKFTALITALLASTALAQVIPTNAPTKKPSSAPSAEPSLEPSLKPSAEPSLKPSASPSDEPSLKPSAEPSLKPSAKPSASPSEVPSLQPTDVPSLTPSASPSDVPSDVPSKSPSMAPSISTAPSALPSAPPTKPDPQIEISFSGFCFNFVNSTLTPVSTYTAWFAALGQAMENVIVAYLNPKLAKPGQRILSFKITEVDGISLARRLEQAALDDQANRKLADVLDVVKYDILFEQFCERGNCDDATVITQKALDFLVTNMGTLTNSTTFLANVKTEMLTIATNLVASNLAGLKMTRAGDCYPTFTVKSILPQMWYPDWTGKNIGCIMDGKEDDYMRLNPEGYYLFATLDACCSRHYSWNYNECAGVDNAALGPDGNALYYPDWEGENKACVNDGAQPEYMSNNPTAWMFETLDACCAARYSWNLNECKSAGGATTATGSDKWYPNWETFLCVKDCVGAAPCGGLAESWDPLYADVSTCCSTKLNWVTDCVASSGGTATTGTTTTVTTSGKFYVDYDTNTCKKDCVGAAPCGGKADSWMTLYDTASLCCTGKLWWVESCGAFAG